MTAYYNEFKPEAAHMLRQLIKDGLIAPGEVDERSIEEVKADDIKGFTQCHFFAGIGGWSVALRLAGWPDTRPVWTGSCPCQDYSSAGKQEGMEGARDLWPVWDGLIGVARPPIIFGEQVKDAIPHGWIDRVRFNVENKGYALGSAVLPAASVNAPHKRDRLWYVADSHSWGTGGGLLGAPSECAENSGRAEAPGQRSAYADHAGGFNGGDMADSELWGRDTRLPGDTGGEGSAGLRPVVARPRGLVDSEHDGQPATENGRGHATSLHGSQRRPNVSEQSAGASMPGELPAHNVGDAIITGLQGFAGYGHNSGERRWLDEEPRGPAPASGFWSDYDWIICGDGKARRIPAVESGICIVANGVRFRAPLLHGFGNAIVPEVAARFIRAVM